MGTGCGRTTQGKSTKLSRGGNFGGRRRERLIVGFEASACEQNRNMDMRVVKVPSLIGGHATANLSVAVWTTLLLTLCIVSSAHDSLLPMKFLLDEAEIADRIPSAKGFEAFGDSFDNLAWIFKHFALDGPLVSLIGFFASTMGLVLAVWKTCIANLTIVEFLLVAFWLVNQTVYIGLPSKEIVISCLVLVLFISSNSNAVVPVFVLSATAVLVYFRTYWGITLCATLLLYFPPPVLRRPVSLVFFALILFAVMAVVFAEVYGESLSFARAESNLLAEYPRSKLVRSSSPSFKATAYS